MTKVHKKISPIFEEYINSLPTEYQMNIWKSIAFYWHVHLYERHKLKKMKPFLPDYLLIQQAVLSVYGKENAEPVLNTLLELGEPNHPFNTLIYEAANGLSPTAEENVHSFCFGCITKFGKEYIDAVKELVERGIIKKTRDQEWIDYLKRCNSFVPEVVESSKT